jgi:hypothetical protein
MNLPCALATDLQLISIDIKLKSRYRRWGYLQSIVIDFNVYTVSCYLDLSSYLTENTFV